jgi:hypothetical protein
MLSLSSQTGKVLNTSEVSSGWQRIIPDTIGSLAIYHAPRRATHVGPSSDSRAYNREHPMQEQPFEQDKMTLTYALIADGGIILAADSQVTHTHRIPTMEGPRIVGTYEGKKSKIRRLGNHCVFSMSGNAGLANTLLARAELAGIDSSESFETLVKEYGNVFAEVYFNERVQLAPRIDVAFLFCGYIGRSEEKRPQIVKLDSNMNFNYNAITDEGFAFTGEEKHGGAISPSSVLPSTDAVGASKASRLLYCCGGRGPRQQRGRPD